MDEWGKGFVGELDYRQEAPTKLADEKTHSSESIQKQQQIINSFLLMLLDSWKVGTVCIKKRHPKKSAEIYRLNFEN